MVETTGVNAVTFVRTHRIFRFLGAVGVLIAIPAFLVSLPPVQAWLFNSKPQVELALISEIPVFDVRQPVTGLAILYNNQDLTSTRRALVVSRLQIRNIGGDSVTPSDLTSTDPLGFIVQGGQILRLRRVRSNSDHLRQFVAPRLGDNTVSLNNGLILDPSDYIEFELMILKPATSRLVYEPVGKVSRQQTIPFINRTVGDQNQGFWLRTFGGGFIEHITRLVIYFLVGLGSLISIAFIISKILDARQAALAAHREKIALAAFEAIPNTDIATSGVGLGVFSFIGQTAFEQLITYLDREYKRSPAVGPANGEATVMDVKVEANRKAVAQYLEQSYVTSPISVILLLQGFDLIQIRNVSDEFMRAAEAIAEFGRKSGAGRYGTGLESYARKAFAIE